MFPLKYTQGMPHRLEKSYQENLGTEPENQESFTGPSPHQASKPSPPPFVSGYGELSLPGLAS